MSHDKRGVFDIDRTNASLGSDEMNLKTLEYL